MSNNEISDAALPRRVHRDAPPRRLKSVDLDTEYAEKCGPVFIKRVADIGLTDIEDADKLVP